MGRAAGELLRDVFPDGLAFFPQDKAIEILPATYAVVGTRAKFIHQSPLSPLFFIIVGCSATED